MRGMGIHIKVAWFANDPRDSEPDSILLDITKIAHFPAYTDTLSPMVKFGCGLYIMIFLLKFLIIGTIVLYEKFGDNDPRTVAPHDPSRSGYKAHEDIAE